jgi:hypothetical protein
VETRWKKGSSAKGRVRSSNKGKNEWTGLGGRRKEKKE